MGCGSFFEVYKRGFEVVTAAGVVIDDSIALTRAGPFDHHSAIVYEQHAWDWIASVPDFGPFDAEAGDTCDCLPNGVESYNGVHLLSNGGVAARLRGALAIDRTPLTLLRAVGFVVRNDRGKSEFALQRLNALHHKAHCAFVFVYLVEVTKRIEDNDIA